MLNTKPKRPYSLRLAQPSYWNKPDPSVDHLWARKASACQSSNMNSPDFWLLDGPPYANGELHLGHVLNKCLKDAFTRHRAATGSKTTWRAGWDCHGLPLELATQKRPGAPDRREPQFLGACRAEAKHWQARQSLSFARLGTLANLESPWTTMDPQREAKGMGLLLEMWEAGVLSERHSPTHWCPTCQSALAASELEKKESLKESLHAWTPLDEDTRHKLSAWLGEPVGAVGLVYWTTTPWTLWANQAFAMSHAGKLSLARLPDSRLALVSTSRLNDVSQAHASGLWKTLAELDNAEFALMQPRALSPLSDKTVPVDMASFAMDSEGSGFVHVAPAFGPEDFEWAESRPDLQLDMSNPMGKDGRYLPTGLAQSGMDRKTAGLLAQETLEHANAVLASSRSKSESQTCWRHGDTVFYMASRQWALDLDKAFSDCPEGLRARALHALDAMEFLPTLKAKHALERMLAGRRFWTLSRDRHWGLPLPFLRDVDGNLSGSTAAWWRQAMQVVEREGVEGYAKMEPPQGLTKEKQCVDVWFDSGASFETAHESGLGSPDLVVEGADQTRGWFLSSMLLGAFRSDKPVFKKVACHGFVVDEKGRKLSKSLGNAPDTEALFQEHGSDTVRLWSLSQSMGDDVVWSKKSLAQAASETKEWRNFLRFLLAHKGESQVFAQPLTSLEHLAVKKCSQAQQLWLAGFEKGLPQVALSALSDFRRWASSTWFELSKRSLYCQAESLDLARRKALFTWAMRMCAPMLASFLPLAVAQALDALGWDQSDADQLWLMAAPLPWNDEMAMNAEQALRWRDGLFKTLDEKRCADGNSKQKYELEDPFAFESAKHLGTEAAHLARGLCFSSSPHRPRTTLWRAVDGWECPRCRGLYPNYKDAFLGSSHDKDWLNDQFGHDLCSTCLADERDAAGAAL
jgi:isoleucyl-tRNA synthetase